MANSPTLWGPNNLSNNLQNGILLANGANLQYGGSKNYVTNGSFQNGTTTGWSLGTIGTLTNGLPTGTPTFGSGASGNLSISTITSGTLGGTYSLSLASSSATTAGNMVAYGPFSIDIEDQAKVLQILGYYSVAVNGLTATGLGGTSSNNIAFALYDATNSSWLSSAGNFNFTQSTGVGKFLGTCQTNSTTASMYLCIYFPVATTSATTFYLKDVFVGPQIAPSGPVVTDWQSYTPTFTGFGTVTGVNFYSRRVGDSLEVQGFFTPGTPTATQAQITLGFGGGNANVVVDATKIASTSIVGKGNINAASTTYFGVDVLATGGNNYVTIGLQSSTASSATSANGNALPGTNSQNAYFFKVPIVGWSSNTSMSSDTDTRVIALSANNPSGTPSTSASTVIYSTVNKDSAGSYNSSTGVYTVPVSGWYSVSASTLIQSTSYVSGNENQMQIQRNGTGIFYGTQYWFGSTVNNSLQCVVSGIYYYNAGDTIQIAASTNSSGTLTWAGAGSYSYLSINRLSGPAVIAATESVYARYTSSSGTSLTGNTATLIAYPTKVSDTHSAYNTSTGIYTVPVSGEYEVSGMVALSAISQSSNTDGAEIQLYQNGSEYASIALCRIQASNTIAPVTSGTVLVHCNAGDQLQIYGLTTATNTLDTSPFRNYFQIKRIGN